MRKLAGLTIFLFCCATDTKAQNFDRPSIADQSFTVPSRAIQIEEGFQHEHEGGNDASVNTFSFPTLLRIGLTDTLEARFEDEVANIVRSSLKDQNDEESLNAPTLGFKYNFYKNSLIQSHPSLGLVARVAPPGGQGSFISRHVNADLHLAIDVDLNDQWIVNINIGGAVSETEHHHTFGTAFGAISIGRSITDSLSTFIETAYQSLETGRGANPGLYLDTGAAYQLGSQFQIDFYGGTDVKRGSHPNFFWTGGISYRFS